MTRHPATRLAAVLTMTAATVGLAYGLARGAPDPKTEPVTSGRWCTTPQVTEGPGVTVSTVQCYPTRGDMLADQLLAERHQAAMRVRAAYRRGLQHGRRTALVTPSARHAIALAAATYGVPEAHMRAVAWCESRLNPSASNRGRYVGLFQAGAPFWQTTPYRGFRREDAYANALATAYTVARQGWRQWSCRPDGTVR